MLDQRALPEQCLYPAFDSARAVAAGIRSMVVRGAPEGIGVKNPVFDVTPAELVTGLITELGVTLAPDRAKIALLFRG